MSWDQMLEILRKAETFDKRITQVVTRFYAPDMYQGRFGNAKVRRGDVNRYVLHTGEVFTV